MLTKELVACRCTGLRVSPSFLQTDKPELLELAKRLLEVYQNAPQGTTRAQLDNELDEIAAAYPRSVKISAAARKILEDKATFSSATEIDYETERARVFAYSAQRIRQGIPADRQTEPDVLQNALFPQKEIYADLPDNDRLLAPPQLSPRELLEKINMGYVQGLLFQAESLMVTLPHANVGELRRLMTRMRFHRLLAEITPISGSLITENQEGLSDQNAIAVRMIIDGPASVLTQNRTYGLQLASFFPAICAIKEWSIQAKVQWKNQTRKLELDQNCGLVTPQTSGSYLPPELELFKKNFLTKAPFGWQFLLETPMLPDGRQKLIFPDYTLVSPEGQKYYVELFHRWHGGQLLPRLEMLDQRDGEDFYQRLPLILGVDRALVGKPEMETRLNQSPWFQQHGFLYRDFPSVEKLLQLLMK